MSRSAIAARGVGKRFGSERVLRDVDLTVEENEILAILGPNGVGKSVLLSCLAGSEVPTTGEVEVLGERTCRGSSGVSLLLQEAMGIDTLTGRENVAFYSRLHPQFTDRWREYVERLGVADDLDKRLGDCSTGMKRKIELAICLSVDEPVYLLDEPTAGLDLSVVQTVHGILRELQDAGKTFVVTSHLPADVDIADRIAFLRGGEITTTGRPVDLLAALPRVVQVRSPSAAADLTEFVRDGRMFNDGGQARGFLRDGIALDRLRAALPEPQRDVPGAAVEAEPTYTDLFNYQTQL